MSLLPFSRNFGCRVSDAFTYQGRPWILMENEVISVSILPDKGAEFFNITYKPLDLNPLARYSFDLAPTPYPATIPNTDGAFQDYNFGGWQEMFPNAGGPASVMGAELGRHGEAALLPWRWQVVTDRSDEVSVCLWVQTRRTPFRLERTVTIRANQANIILDETITNTGKETWPYLWGHHPAFGAPFLSSDCVLDVPAGRIETHHQPQGTPTRLPAGAHGQWPKMQDVHGKQIDLRFIPPPTTGTADMFYLLDLKSGWYALTNRVLGAGFALIWDKNVFPVLWVWQEFKGSQGSPWFSNAYVTGLEPCTGYAVQGSAGLTEAIKAGYQRHLMAGESLSTRLQAVLFHKPGIQGVREIDANSTQMSFIE